MLHPLLLPHQHHHPVRLRGQTSLLVDQAVARRVLCLLLAPVSLIQNAAKICTEDNVESSRLKLKKYVGVGLSVTGRCVARAMVAIV